VGLWVRGEEEISNQIAGAAVEVAWEEVCCQEQTEQSV